MASTAATTLSESFFCDRCGEEFETKHRVCAGCGTVPTRQWFQLMSLTTLLAAVACNSAVGWFLLPRLAFAHRAATLFRVWLWMDAKAATYAWIPIIGGLMAWDHFIWRRAKLRGTSPKLKRWLTKKMLALVVAASVTPLIPWWIPADQVPNEFISLLSKYPGLGSSLAWGVLAFVLMLLCGHRQTRDSLLGRGHVLSLLSVCALLLVLAVTLAGWSLSY